MHGTIILTMLNEHIIYFSWTNYGLNFIILRRILRMFAHAHPTCELLKKQKYCIIISSMYSNEAKQLWYESTAIYMRTCSYKYYFMNVQGTQEMRSQYMSIFYHLIFTTSSTSNKLRVRALHYHAWHYNTHHVEWTHYILFLN